MHKPNHLPDVPVRKRPAERINAGTHGVGILLAVIATAFLWWKGWQVGTALAMVSYTVYGISMILLYTASTIYHSLSWKSYARRLRVLDHVGIFFLIAGTYTPVALLVIGGRIGIFLTVCVWCLAFLGIFLKVFWIEKARRVSTIIYILMGWLVLFFIKPFYLSISPFAFWFIFAGGVIYTLGTLFYRMKSRVFAHTVWHLFVMAGSALMFVGIYFGT